MALKRVAVALLLTYSRFMNVNTSQICVWGVAYDRLVKLHDRLHFVLFFKYTALVATFVCTGNMVALLGL